MDNRILAFYRPGQPMKINLRTSARHHAVWASLLALPVLAQEPRPDWEGAIGPNLSYAPAYAGAQDHRTKLVPGFFLRWGRVTLTNSSGFVTRRSDDVVRGLGLNLSPSDRIRVNLALRFDAGRSASDSPALAGLGNVRSTVRVRLSGSWLLGDGWRLGSGLSVDAAGRGGGGFADLSIVREQRLSSATTWSWGSSVAVASSGYMRSYFRRQPRAGRAHRLPALRTRCRAARCGGICQYPQRTRAKVGGAGRHRRLAPARPCGQQPLDPKAHWLGHQRRCSLAVLSAGSYGTLLSGDELALGHIQFQG